MNAQAIATIMQRRINPDINFKAMSLEEPATTLVDRVLASPTVFSSIEASIEENDSDDELDPMSVFALTAPVRQSVHVSLPYISDDEDDEAVKAPKAPNPPKAPRKVSKEAKSPEVDEKQKAERKRLSDENRAVKKHKEAVEARRQIRVRAGRFRAEALSVLDGKVPLGERWEVAKTIQTLRARSVPGVADVCLKRAILDDTNYMPTGFKRDSEGRTHYTDSEAGTTKAQEHLAFVTAAGTVKQRRIDQVQNELRAFVAAKRVS